MSDIATRIRSRFDHVAARQNLREKYQAKMTFAHAGGMWKAGPELLSVLACCPDSQAVILDVYETPVQIQVQELQALAQQRWQEQMTAWLMEWDQLQKQR